MSVSKKEKKDVYQYFEVLTTLIKHTIKCKRQEPGNNPAWCVCDYWDRLHQSKDMLKRLDIALAIGTKKQYGTKTDDHHR